jgi:putative oxidoreductase
MKRSQQFLLGGAGGADPVADAGLLILRLFTGLALALAHGIGKIPPAEGFVGMIGGAGLPLPGLFGWFSAFAEFGGGLLLAIGLLTRPASLLIVLNMLGALLIAHTDDPFLGMEKPLLFLFIALMFLLTGPGRFSVDALIRGRQDRSTVSRFVRH